MMSILTANEIREKYLKFFEGKGHKRLPSAPLIPENDPTVLFTTAGMHPLVPYLLGEKHPLGTRLCNSQKCIRTGDIDDVGDNTHGTFFEMLGNWSLGDYFKKEAIEWSFEFLTKELRIPLEKLAFTVFDPSIDLGQEGQSPSAGSGQVIPKDEEAFNLWQNLGVKPERIAYLGHEDNWWGPAGATGPCGPDTEMFYWAGENSAPEKFNPQDKQWVEIWNNVFMQYNKTADGKFEELSQKNVDTGMGLERTTAILQGKNNVYATELFTLILSKIAEISGKQYEENTKSFRIIADHIKASVFILSDGLVPSNTERGYVLRRLIRRAIRYGKLLGIENAFMGEVAKVVIEMYEDIYIELKENQEVILSELQKEEERFLTCLDRGLKEFEKIKKPIISGEEVFNLYQSYGFPLEITREIAKEKGKEVDEKGFEIELKKHQDLSRTASAGQFKSGLADDSQATTKYHTATHLMLAALRQVLGEDIQQKGSNITSERIRFDFNFERKLTEQEIKKIEDLVNEKIKMALPVVCCEMETKEALKEGATGVFGHKYPDKVKVYSVGPSADSASSPQAGSGRVFSKEICAGPHVENTKELGVFKIVKQEASSSGVRRIKAILQQ
ncbi:MAG: alanine--tRNA ligase [Candidatus Pacebacteria bacterium]|nr:alanine--tRNA ligase [Candidatus Paceibacterota bacterium]